jgi:hypothetical protein
MTVIKTIFFEKMVCDRITPIIRPIISEAHHGFNKRRFSLMQFSNFVIGQMEEGLCRWIQCILIFRKPSIGLIMVR